MTMPDLLPCPFCGGDAEMTSHNVHESGDFKKCFVVECRDNHCCKKAAFTKWGYDKDGPTLNQAKESAVKAWNTRAQPPSADCVMVPREPTTDMREAGRRTGYWKDLHCNPTEVYKAMLAAAPQNNPALVAKPVISGDDLDVEGIGRTAGSNPVAGATLHGDPDDDQVRGVECPPMEDCSPCNKGWRFAYGVDNYHFPCPNCAKSEADGVDLLDPEMPTQQLRLHMGELTPNEVLVARAAIRWANTRKVINRGVDIEKLREAVKFVDTIFVNAESFELWNNKIIRCVNVHEEDIDLIIKAARAYLEMMEKKDG